MFCNGDGFIVTFHGCFFFCGFRTDIFFTRFVEPTLSIKHEDDYDRKVLTIRTLESQVGIPLEVCVIFCVVLPCVGRVLAISQPLVRVVLLSVVLYGSEMYCAFMEDSNYIQVSEDGVLKKYQL